MAFSDILSAAIPMVKSIIGEVNDQYSPGKSEDIYRACLYRTLDTLDEELARRKRIKQQEEANKNNDIPSKEMILAKLQSDIPNTPTTYNSISDKSYKWSCKI